MSDEEVLAGDLQQTMRVLATIGGQMGERVARLRAERARDEQARTQEQIRGNADQARAQEQDLERRRRDDLSAARSVYAGVRDDRFWRDDHLPARAGEALAVSKAMSPADPLATTAHDYLRREIDHRYGPEAEAWTLAALAAYREELQRLEDRKSAEAEADHHTEAARDATVRGDDPDVELEAADRARAEAEHHEQQRAAARNEGQEAQAQADTLHERSANVATGERDNLQTRDPEAYRARETANLAHPRSIDDLLQQQPTRTSGRAARKATPQTGREAARGSGRS